MPSAVPRLLRVAVLVALGVGQCLGLVGTAEAQQIEFRRAGGPGDEQLSYRWRDHDRRQFTTSFSLSRAAVRQAENSFRDFSLEDMWSAAESEMRDEIARSGRGVRVDLRRSARRMDWTVEARDPVLAEALSRRLQVRLNSSQDTYLVRHLRRRVDDRRIMLDFAAAAQALQDAMSTVARALDDDLGRGVGDGDRRRVAHALAFFQGIPYAILEDATRQGGDFLPAPALLVQNRGDCDSKAVALAAVLRGLAPARKLAVVTMPGHAVLAVDLPPRGQERTIRVGDRFMVVLEAAGPALAPVGRVGPATEQLMRAGPLEIWPLD